MNNYSTTIECYLSKQMNKMEMQEFEQQLLHDETLASLYKETITARNLIKEAGRIDLKNKLNEFENTLSNPTKVMSLWKRFAQIAAVFALLFGVYYFVNTNRSLSVSEIYASNFKVYKSPITVRSSNDVKETNWLKASDFYKQESYGKALVLFQQSENDIPNYLSSFYLGICNMAKENSNYEQALLHFDTVIKSDNDYQQQANWYKALCLLKLSKKDKALVIFNDISKEEGFNFKKARSIIKQLN
jgi:tetratricopeptide (TPR) repeat protein